MSTYAILPFCRFETLQLPFCRPAACTISRLRFPRTWWSNDTHVRGLQEQADGAEKSVAAEMATEKAEALALKPKGINATASMDLGSLSGLLIGNLK